MSVQIIPKKDLIGIKSVRISNTVINRINLELKKMAGEEIVPLCHIVGKMPSREVITIFNMLKNAGYYCHHDYDEEGYYHNIEVYLV